MKNLFLDTFIIKHKILNDDEDGLHSIKLNRVQLFLIIMKLNRH